MFFRFVEHYYATLRLLSVDVALAGLGAGVLAARLLGAWPRPVFYVVLPLAVWVVYTLDHLLDARHIGSNVSTPRHRFHRRFAKPLWILCVMAGLVCGVLGLMELSVVGIYFGLCMVVLFVLHESIVKLAGNRASPLLLKEIGVAVIFTAGTWGLPLMLYFRDRGALPKWLLFMLLQYLLLAFVNLLVFAILEMRVDQRQGQSSFARGVGRRNARRMALLGLLVQPIVAVGVVVAQFKACVVGAEVIYLAMAVALLMVLWYPKWFMRRERYRAFGDGVFLLPLLMGL